MRGILICRGIFVCTLVLATHSVAYGDGFRIPYQGAAAAGQAEAFAAQADDASAIYYNPAGLTQLEGIQIYVGTNFITGHTDFTSQTGETATSDLGGSVAWPPPSHLYVTANLEDLAHGAFGPLSVGIGLNSPFGLVIRWPDEGPFSSVVTEATLPLLDIKPTMAYELFDMLSLGIGADIYTFASFIGEGQFERKANFAGVVPTELNGKGTSLGYNVSALLTPLRNADGKPRMNFGVVYRSGTDLELNGEFLQNGTKFPGFDSKFTLALPQVVSGGLAGWPIRNETHEWKLEYDMEWIGWSSLQNLDVSLSNGAVIPAPLNWNDTYTLSFGTEFKWLKPTSLPDWEIAGRAGYQRSQAPDPDRFYDPTVPDSNWNIFAVGLGLKCKEGGKLFGVFPCGCETSNPLVPKAIVLDLGFSAAFWESRTITDSIVNSTLIPNSIVNGTYETKGWYIGHISAGFAF